MSSASGGEERKGTRRSKVASLRYYLAFQIELIGHHDIEVRGYKLSLPVAALVHSSIEADASLFWDRAFADGTGILSSVPERVPWEQAKAALNRKFLSLMQEVQEAKDTKASLLHPRSITSDNMEHLALRLDVSNNMLSKKNFFAKMVANKLDKDGKPTPCPFYEWFYRCAAMTNKYMQEQWNDGLVDGFCSKDRAEAQLQTSSAPTMLIRFSDVIFGHLKLSCRLADGKIVHYEAEADAMPAGTTIANAIRSNPTFSSISYVFPNEPLARIWEGKDSCREKKASETRSQVYSTWTSLPPDYFASTLILENKPVAAKH
uniref:SH2 domain-containing protein n=1 Tax=Plectus sambesii TaxID=2011161 RepID=A0A914UXU8_9BILA